MRFSLSFTPVIVRAVLHKELVGPKSDKLLVPITWRFPKHLPGTWEIAAKLKDYWDRDCFMVPTQVHVVRGWK
jgi:hypothetical protein